MTNGLVNGLPHPTAELVTVESLEANNPRAGKSTTVATYYALQHMFWFRTVRNFKDPLFLYGRLADKITTGESIRQSWWQVVREEGSKRG